MPNTREKLIELVTAALCNQSVEEVADHLIANGVTLDNQVASSSKQLASSEWISVKDRLPKSIANKVIVRCENDYIGFGHYEDYKGKQTWYNLESDKPFTDWNYDDDCDSYEVTHWMPLPEPPKGE